MKKRSVWVLLLVFAALIPGVVSAPPAFAAVCDLSTPPNIDPDMFNLPSTGARPQDVATGPDESGTQYLYITLTGNDAIRKIDPANPTN